jgi:HlyD family secretion protein
MKRALRYLVMVLVLGALGFGGWRWFGQAKTAKVTYKTQPLQERRVAAKVTASGTLQAKVTVQVGAQVSGRISKLGVDFNDPVKKGQVIAKLDPQMFQAAVAQANASHAAAKAAVVKAEAQQHDAELVLARTQSLAEQSLATAADLQTAQTAVVIARAGTDAARASLAQATAGLNQAQVNLSYTTICSPIDGVVISRNVDVGQTVAASLQAPVLFTIAEDLRRMQVHTSVAEADVGRLEPGMAATFTVDAFPGRRFEGKLVQIRNAATTVQNVVTYDAVLDAANEDLKLRPGMTATVTVIWSEKERVLATPNAALRFWPPEEAGITATATATGTARAESSGDGSVGGKGRRGKRDSRTLWVLRGARPVAVTIDPGISDGSYTEVVKAEVSAGEEVIVDAEVDGKAASSSSGVGATPGGAQPRMGRMF